MKTFKGYLVEAVDKFMTGEVAKEFGLIDGVLESTAPQGTTGS